MNDPMESPRPAGPTPVEIAREVFTASRNAPADRERAAYWWGKTEAALEMLLAYVDEQEGRA